MRRFLLISGRSARLAFSLVEIVLALGVFAFCILAVLSLFSIGLESAKESDQEIRAANLASSLVCRMRSAPRVDLTGIGFPFAPVAGAAAGEVFKIPTDAPIYMRGDGLKAASAEEAGKSNGYAVAATAIQEDASRVSRLSLTLWWPASVTFRQARGTYTVNTFIDTEAR